MFEAMLEDWECQQRSRFLRAATIAPRLRLARQFGKAPAQICPAVNAFPPVIPSYTEGVKTAISVPDDTYERVSKRAQELGMSRSELFSRAAARYLDQLDSESVTRQIDLAVASLGQSDDSSADAVAAGHRLLATTTDEW
jgi:metal-responsive CopG/Arc/MetJ family transcriptional regulator